MKYLISLLTMTHGTYHISVLVENAKAQSLLGVYGDWTAYTKTEQNH